MRQRMTLCRPTLSWAPHNRSGIISGKLLGVRIYLDLCCLKRPFDVQEQALVRIQTQAVVGILALPPERAQLIRSEAHAYENSFNPLKLRREAIEAWIAQVPLSVLTESELATRTDELIRQGFKSFDAVHLATAELAGADLFVTVDIRFLKVASRISTIRCRVTDPVTLIEELSQWKH